VMRGRLSRPGLGSGTAASSARQIADSLMLGYVDPNAVIDGGQTVLVESWLQVCTAAHRAFTA